jgi:MFS family permease
LIIRLIDALIVAPAIGPIAGGYISQTIGWKYIFIFIAGLCALSTIVAIPVLRETYGPVIRLRRHRAQHGDLEKFMLMHPELNNMQGNRLRYLWLNLSRPTVILTRSLICFMLALYMAFTYGCFYSMVSSTDVLLALLSHWSFQITTFPELYSNIYGFNSGTGGLSYIALGLGFISAILVGARLGNAMYKKV